MKKIFLVLALLTFIGPALASDFCKGFEDGFKTAYKRAKNTSLNPLTPLCPLQPLKGFGDPESDYEHGYVIGIEKGYEKAANK